MYTIKAIKFSKQLQIPLNSKIDMALFLKVLNCHSTLKPFIAPD